MTKTIKTLFLCLIIIAGLCISVCSASTTEVRLVRYAADGVTILNEKVVDYTWMESNLPVLGDGSTHYYHQGPIFEGDIWNPAEDENLKDMGAVKGTDLRDLCELVGGMSEGETVTIKASDGLRRTFPYSNVYNPESRQGPMGITWYHHEDGYVPDYQTGMRLIFFADTSVNPEGKNVFGVADKRETFPQEYWYFYNGIYPTTTGISVQYVSEIIINSEAEPTGSIQIDSDPIGASVYLDDQDMGRYTPCTLTDIETGMYTVSVRLEGYEIPDEEWVTVTHKGVEFVHFNLTKIGGTIEITSLPSGAGIFLDGEDTGLLTDALLEFVEPGERIISLVKEGYKNETLEVDVEVDETTIIDVILIPESGPSMNKTGVSSNQTGVLKPITETPVKNVSSTIDPAGMPQENEQNGSLTEEEGTHGSIISFFRFIWNSILSLFGITLVSEENILPPPDSEFDRVEIETGSEKEPDQSEEVLRNHSGGLYIESYPPEREIVLDNRKTPYTTPVVLYGIREGLHSIRFEANNKYDATPNQRVWVNADAIMPIRIDTIGYQHKRTITIDSLDFADDRFTVNGMYPLYSLPETVECEGDGGWITIHCDNAYYSYSIPDRIRDGETLTIQMDERAEAYLMIESDPRGASVFINGFPVEEETPAIIDNLSPGKHRIVVSKPGYLPATGEIKIRPKTTGSAGTIRTSLTPYESGSLSINSTPTGQRIYLYERYTGETTPHVFEHMRIGTYEVKIQGQDETISRMMTVVPNELTECMI
ncbi:MAG: Uncharacterized protein XE11_0008 [Methanomicrobiales archaeon 53_19]|jgi:hypothetical protein|uniref:PEGA domain-containing protein n=1 Tax=Methanocalculus sp. TaxID=2004547 RepID=UPI0007467F6B|nr:PEGA domain-containing protein [Methanocalculus sp.]KUK71261.1 MAG: Uncharacterized protein XD88_0152 [Methanocalculus sp. 52_23]KUL05146.1 MAG: Uncharacterized protein XE11_0008 [Methanomicrobiales archaeon 53_19]HIJ05848.1 PEGA domain-containing protein [Methanocalculus sp.]